MTVLAFVCLICALLPCVLFFCNLREYRAPLLPVNEGALPPVSVLIPARNEEENIARAVSSVLSNTGIELELIVLDDHSTDRTAAIVREYAAKDLRVRLETAPPLPQGWCGKQHACAALAERARFPLLVFMDADVRLAPDALARMAQFVTCQNVALASGVPRQIIGSFWEKLLIPLIHFVLLGFLPMRRMRSSIDPAYAAGCGQLFIARADAYRSSGGHGAIRSSMHDGIKLPRLFRQNGFRTDLFDATALASCRMYHNVAETFAGLAKNAVEGLAAPARIVPVTALLLLGQVVPYALLCMSATFESTRWLAAMAVVCSLAPRLATCARFRQPLSGALLHPLGIGTLLLIQWFALIRHLSGRPAQWRGRACPKLAAFAAATGLAATAFGGTNEANRIPEFALSDQHDSVRRFSLPATNLTFIVVADHKGSEQLEKWIKPVYDAHGKQLRILGVADVSKVPASLRPVVRRAFVKQLSYPVMLDWSGEVSKLFTPKPDAANVYLVQTNGAILRQWSGPATTARLRELSQAIAQR